MLSTARAVSLAQLACLPLAGLAQTGPSDPQIIAAAPTAKINVGTRKLAGHMVATVRVGDDGRVRDVLVTENTTESAFEPQLVKVLQSARFRPAIDAAGKPVEASIDDEGGVARRRPAASRSRSPRSRIRSSPTRKRRASAR